MINQGTNATPLIAQNYIKYERLVQMVDTAFVGSNATEITIYIDLYSVLLPIFGQSFNLATVTSDYEIAAAIINMISHYRNFFWTRYRVTSKFHLVWSNNRAESSVIFNQNYNNKMKQCPPEQMDYVLNNLDAVAKIAPYLNDVCLTCGRFEVSVIMYDIMVSSAPTTNIIITKDVITMQLAGLVDNTIIFRPKKVNQEDVSFYIAKDGLIQYLLDIRGAKTSGEGIDGGLLSSILALNNLPERGLKTVLPISTVVKLIKMGILEKGILNAHHYDVMNIINTFDMENKAKCIRACTQERFKAIDTIYQWGIYSNHPDKFMYKGFQNLYDPNGLHYIVSELFKDTPLNLERM